MEFSSCVSVTFFIFMVTLAPLANANGVAPKFYNVMDYGAVADGKTDNSEAFLKAWDEACKSVGRSRVLIPKGTYMVNSLTFKGKCLDEIGVLIKGTLMAPTDPSQFFTTFWIRFQYVDSLVVSGGGYLDGQGHSAWKYNDCSTNHKCKSLPATMSFDFVTNSRVLHLQSINSKNAHFTLFACENMDMNNLRISAPDTSPNTDGIKIGASNGIRISQTVIETGDDCIAMVAGSENINITEVSCGPGHGISIGSLGKGPNESDVSGVTVKNCSFNGTQNGVRIKTWAKSFPTKAENFWFENIQMKNVKNPIFIDQQYCPGGKCDKHVQSVVQIKQVTFRNIWGTSSSKDAVILNCSALYPCQDVNLVDINLSHIGRGGPASSSCMNVKGKAYGVQNPGGCM